MYVNPSRLQRGLSLVEVFVALLVLSVGLIALAKLQVDLVRGSGDARARTVALSLAEEKIEDLRTFVVADGSGSWSATANPMAWSYISGPAIGDPPCIPPSTTPCTGGRIGPQTSYSSTLEVAGVRFLRTWEVGNPGDPGFPLHNFTGTGPITSRTKDVTVTVSWQNEAGTTQSVNLVANLVEIPPGNVALASQPVSVRPAGPQPTYIPGLAPEVIGIDIGGSKKRETTKPLPDVVGGSGTNVVRFDVVNYHGNVADRREEFASVNCGCSIDTAGPARTPARFSYVGNVLRDVPGQVVTKTRGSYSATGQNFDDVCVVCCRDHHDYSSGGIDYRYNPADTSDHQHYKRQTNGTYTLASSVGDPYDEACRLKRVNGVFQVFEDWNPQAVNTIPAADLVAGASTQTAYKNYVADVVRKYVDSSQPPPTVPTFSSTTLAPGGSAQLQGRAIFIDYMTNAQKAVAAALITPSNNQSVLEAVPWYEVNLTKIANWKLEDINTTNPYPTVSGQNCHGSTSQVTLTGFIACVANQAIVDESINQNNYFRGLLKAGPIGGTLDAQTWLRNGNTGVTGTEAITAASNSATPVFSEYRFTNNAAAQAAVSGGVVKGANAPSGNIWGSVGCSYTVNGGGSTSCTSLLIGNGNNSRSFSIPAIAGDTVVVTITYPGHVVSPASQSITAPNSNVGFTLDP